MFSIGSKAITTYNPTTFEITNQVSMFILILPIKVPVWTRIQNKFYTFCYNRTFEMVLDKYCSTTNFCFTDVSINLSINSYSPKIVKIITNYYLIKSN